MHRIPFNTLLEKLSNALKSTLSSDDLLYAIESPGSRCRLHGDPKNPDTLSVEGRSDLLYDAGQRALRRARWREIEEIDARAAMMASLRLCDIKATPDRNKPLPKDRKSVV